MTTNPKVFIASFSSVNYESLNDFGELVKEPLTTGYVDFSDMSTFYKKFLPVLEKTKPEDFLALSGAAVACVVIAQLWLKYHGIVRMLSFDKKRGVNGGYKEVILTNALLVPDHGSSETDDS